MKKIIYAMLLIFLCGSAAPAASAQQAGISVEEARIVLHKLMNSYDGSIPHGLMQGAKAVIIVPSLLKGGFIVGASYGKGVALIRQADGKMGAPVFFNVGGASLGLQAGGQSSDLVLVVASSRGLRGLLQNQMTIGTDLSIAAGPVGRQGKMAVSGASRDADLYSYSSTVGLFAGISLDGTGLSYDQDGTSAYYGHKLGIAEAQLLEENKIPLSGRQLMRELDEYMAR